MARDVVLSTPAKAAADAEAKMRELDRKAGSQADQFVALSAIVAGLPGACIGRNTRATAPPAGTGTSVATSQPVLSTSAPVKAGRVYEVRALHFGLYSNLAGTAQANLLFTLDGTEPTTASGVLDQVDIQIPAGGIPEDAQLDRTYVPSAEGVLSVLLTYYGPGTCHMNGSATWPIELLIIDLGMDPGVTGTTY